ncbi:hypothetical protein ABNN70_11255 [Sporolactobacillus sp. Y61]|uniref:Uncharacterized protein n=1 Tax=Sporolactobacillus sp. Y61 TaxID=3160863 RepID=A0AAU8IK63_9BACL
MILIPVNHHIRDRPEGIKKTLSLLQKFGERQNVNLLMEIDVLSV